MQAKRPRRLLRDYERLLTELRLLRGHAQMALFMVSVGGLATVALLVLWQTEVIDDTVASTLLAVPVTVATLGVFGVAYEYFLRGTFREAMRSVVSAWDTGVTVHLRHDDAPNRDEVLRRLSREGHIRLLSTTLNRYFAYSETEFKRQLVKGATAQIIIYEPDSPAVREKEMEESKPAGGLNTQIVGTCLTYLGPFKRVFGDRVQIRFCPFNVPFGMTVIDESYAVVSLNVYGLARDKNETPCLEIVNRAEDTSAFSLYRDAFDALWSRLPDSIPPQVAQYFASSEATGAGRESGPMKLFRFLGRLFR